MVKFNVQVLVLVDNRGVYSKLMMSSSISIIYKIKCLVLIK